MTYDHRPWAPYSLFTVAVKHLMFLTSHMSQENFLPLPSSNSLPCSLPPLPQCLPPSLVPRHSQQMLKCSITHSYSYLLPFAIAKTELFCLLPLLQYLPVNRCCLAHSEFLISIGQLLCSSGCGPWLFGQPAWTDMLISQTFGSGTVSPQVIQIMQTASWMVIHQRNCPARHMLPKSLTELGDVSIF